jgi:hypothetical protein
LENIEFIRSLAGGQAKLERNCLKSKGLHEASQPLGGLRIVSDCPAGRARGFDVLRFIGWSGCGLDQQVKLIPNVRR